MPAKRKKTDNNTTGASPAAHQIGAPVEEMPAQTSPGESAPADDRFENTPILPLRGLIVYPETIVPLLVGQPRSVRLVDDLSIGEGLIALFASLDADNESPGPDELYRVGTLASVERMFRASDGTIRLLLQGLNRIRLDHVTSTEPYLRGTVIAAPEIVEQGIEVEALMRNIQELFTRFSHLVSSLPDDLLAALSGMGNPLQVAYTIATYVRMSLEDGQALLEDDHLAGKLRRLAGLLGRELELLELGQKIQSEAQSEIEKVQREYFLREQLKAIQRELGEGDEQQADVHEFREKIEQVGMSEEARKDEHHLPLLRHAVHPFPVRRLRHCHRHGGASHHVHAGGETGDGRFPRDPVPGTPARFLHHVSRHGGTHRAPGPHREPPARARPIRLDLHRRDRHGGLILCGGALGLRGCADRGPGVLFPPGHADACESRSRGACRERPVQRHPDEAVGSRRARPSHVACSHDQYLSPHQKASEEDRTHGWREDPAVASEDHPRFGGHGAYRLVDQPRSCLGRSWKQPL